MCREYHAGQGPVKCLLVGRTDTTLSRAEAVSYPGASYGDSQRRVAAALTFAQLPPSAL